jgi:hypothetical protein
MGFDRWNREWLVILGREKKSVRHVTISAKNICLGLVSDVTAPGGS